MKIGDIYRFNNDYVLVVKKFRDEQIDRVAAYYVLFPNGTLDTVPASSLTRPRSKN